MRTHLLLGLLSLNILISCRTANFKGAAATRSLTKPTTGTPVVETPVTPAPEVVPTEAPTVPAAPPVAVVTPPAVTPPVETPPPVAPPAVVPVTPEVIPPSPPSKDIEFGSDKIFRIGDGFAYITSSCVGEVTTFPLSGTTYYFQFQVYEDDTQIDLSIGRICGVDQLDKDTFALINDRTKAVVLAEVALPKLSPIAQANPWVPYTRFNLGKGLYSVVIQSKNIYGHPKIKGVAPDPSKDEYDDFLVGNIRIKANKDVRAEKIYTE